MPRPTPTPELVSIIARNLRVGAYRQDAVAAAGIAYQTFRNWIKRGGVERRRIDSGSRPRKREGAFLALVEAVEKAEAEASMLSLGRITKAAAEGAWQADAWKLERRYPDRWGRKQRVDLEAKGGLVVEGGGWLADRLRCSDEEPE